MQVASSRLDSYNFLNKKVLIVLKNDNISESVKLLGGEVIPLLEKEDTIDRLEELVRAFAKANVVIFPDGWKEDRSSVVLRFCCQNYEVDAIEI